MRITDTQQSSILTLDRLKAYANIVDCTRDDELRAVLRSAALRVAQYADIALLGCTIEETVEDAAAVQLWMPPVASVDAVTDVRTGADVTAECFACGSRFAFPYEGSFTIRYTVAPDEATVQKFAPLVWQMAVAIWDGNTEEEQRIYARIPAGYVVQ